MERTRERWQRLIRDPYLATALNELLSGLEGERLSAAEAAIVETFDSGVVGDHAALVRAYKNGIRRALDPSRKTIVGHIDRKTMKNPQLAAIIDRELQDVTKEELAHANAAVRELVEASRAHNSHRVEHGLNVGRAAHPEKYERERCGSRCSWRDGRGGFRSCRRGDGAGPAAAAGCFVRDSLGRG